MNQSICSFLLLLFVLAKLLKSIRTSNFQHSTIQFLKSREKINETTLSGLAKGFSVKSEYSQVCSGHISSRHWTHIEFHPLPISLKHANIATALFRFHSMCSPVGIAFGPDDFIRFHICYFPMTSFQSMLALEQIWCTINSNGNHCSMLTQSKNHKFFENIRTIDSPSVQLTRCLYICFLFTNLSTLCVLLDAIPIQISEGCAQNNLFGVNQDEDS